MGMNLTAYAKQQGFSYQTAWRVWQRCELPAHRLPTGTLIVDVLTTSPAVRHLLVAVYARASSAENRNNLGGHAERVAALCAARGWQLTKGVKECGSAVNDQCPQLLALLAASSISHIVVEHLDRRTYFGVPSIRTLVKAQERELLIVNGAANCQKDLRQDFVAIIKSFCARLCGRGCASQKITHWIPTLEAN